MDKVSLREFDLPMNFFTQIMSRSVALPSEPYIVL